MAIFKRSIDYVLAHSCGYIDRPTDPEDSVFWGVSLRFLKATRTDVDVDGDIDSFDSTLFTKDELVISYQTEIWEKLKLDKIKEQYIATKILDMSVNMGAKQATKIVQKALKETGEILRIDGKLGTKTRAAINDIDPVKLLSLIRSEQASFYKSFVKNNPKFEEYLTGLLNRAGA